jgi:hypothetical protein
VCAPHTRAHQSHVCLSTLSCRVWGVSANHELRRRGRERTSARDSMMRSALCLAMISSAMALAPSRPCVRVSHVRRSLLKHAAAAALLPNAANAADKKPTVKEEVAKLDASVPKEQRNAAGDKAEFFPQIAFEGSQGQGKKVVFTVAHENRVVAGTAKPNVSLTASETTSVLSTSKLTSVLSGRQWHRRPSPLSSTCGSKTRAAALF